MTIRSFVTTASVQRSGEDSRDAGEDRARQGGEGESRPGTQGENGAKEGPG